MDILTIAVLPQSHGSRTGGILHIPYCKIVGAPGKDTLKIAHKKGHNIPYYTEEIQEFERKASQQDTGQNSTPMVIPHVFTMQGIFRVLQWCILKRMVNPFSIP